MEFIAVNLMNSRIYCAQPWVYILGAHIGLWIVTSSTSFRWQLFCKETWMNLLNRVPFFVCASSRSSLIWQLKVFIGLNHRAEVLRAHQIWIQSVARGGAPAGGFQSCVLDIGVVKEKAELRTVRLDMLCLLFVSQGFPFNHTCSISCKCSSWPLQSTALP